VSDRLDEAVFARRRARTISGLRGLTGRDPSRASVGREPGGGEPVGDVLERCDLCGVSIPQDHRHLLHLIERRIVCSCEGCWAMRAGEGDYRPVGARTVWLPDLQLPDDLWASFQVPIGLAFFMRSTITECVVAMYPSPAGATESELRLDAWARMTELNPVVAGLEADIEGLIVNRLCDPPLHVIAPIDRCYELTGVIKASWEGISGGSGVERAVLAFFDQLREQAR
jgi:hypothetical protein